MGRRRKGHGCAVTVLVLMLLLMAAGGAGGYIYMRKYMPSDELSDKAKAVSYTHLLRDAADVFSVYFSV